MALAIGDTIGDYQIVDILGFGGMGQVYKVRNQISKRVEAMKVLLPNLEGNPQLADRFMQEIEVQAQLDHPNIAALRTAQRSENQLVMVMEYVEGATIDSLIRRGPIAIDKALDYAIQVLGALSYAHSRHIVHRDIKPANMMLTPQGVLKLLDFGIAKITDRKLTQTGHTVGSLFYMSPEQINDPQNIDARSDLYSVGISLYEMVTGKRPFQGDSDYSIMLGHLTRHPEPPIAVDPSLPQALNDAILMSIVKEREGRFQTATAFRGALEHVRSLIGPVVQSAPRPITNLGPSVGTQPSVPPPGAQTPPLLPSDPKIAPPPIPSYVPPAALQSPSASNSPAQSAVPPPPTAGSKRGVWIAAGSLATIAVLVLVAWQGPRLFQSTSASQRTTAPPIVPESAPPTASSSSASSPSSDPSSSSSASTPPAEEPKTMVFSDGKDNSVQIGPNGISIKSAGKQIKVPFDENKNTRQVTTAQSQTPATAPMTQPVPAQPNPPSAPAKNEPDRAALQAVRTSFIQVGARARSANQALDRLERQMAGAGLRGDMAAARSHMEAQLDEAESALKWNDVETAAKSVAAAERDLEKIEKFLGR